MIPPKRQGTKSLKLKSCCECSDTWGAYFLLTPSKTKIKKFLESNVMSDSIIRTSQMSF